MTEIVKTYRQELPTLRFIGKQYGDGDRGEQGYAPLWDRWFAGGWFAPLEALCGGEYEDCGAAVGMMRMKEGEPFQYWIGMLCPKNAPVPAGYGAVDFPSSSLGVTWLRGRGAALYQQEARCVRNMQDHGYRLRADEQGAFWAFERYTPSRFGVPDSAGNVTLDICVFID